MQVRLNTNNTKNQNFGRLSNSLNKCVEWAIENGSNPKALMGVVDEINAITRGKVVSVADNFGSKSTTGYKEWIAIRKEGLIGLLFGRKKLEDALKYDSSDPINLFKEVLDRLKKQSA